MLEVWQADGDGRYPGADPALANALFKGFGRVECNAEGRYSFHTVKPGRVPGPNGVMQAPHLNVGVFARGILRRLFTRIYFEDEAANASDPILALVPAEARQTSSRAGSERGPTCSTSACRARTRPSSSRPERRVRGQLPCARRSASSAPGPPD